MKISIKGVKEFVTENLFVKDIKCIFCGKELNSFSKYCCCDECLKSLPFNDKKICQKCGEKITSLANFCLNCKNNADRGFDKARAPFLYQEPITATIHKLKYFNGKYLADYLNSFLIDEYVLSGWKADLVVPIPLHEKRLKSRGFNQAELLCEGFNKKLNLPVSVNNFVRIKDTPTQTELTKKEREINLQNAFKVVDKSVFKNKSILLIDDVFTTGSTMEEASFVLKKADAKSVYTLTLAHVWHKKI